MNILQAPSSADGDASIGAMTVDSKSKQKLIKQMST